jgi:hypothetical protein
MSATNGLTDKQAAFVEAYLTCWNGAEAARQAGYAYPRQSAYENLSKPYIQQVIRNRLLGLQMTADEALNRLADQARGDIGDFLGKGGILNLEDAKDQGLTHLIKSISWTKYGVKIELYDAQAALMHIDRYHGGLDGGAIEERQAVRFDLSDLSDRELDTVATIAERIAGDTDGAAAP